MMIKCYAIASGTRLLSWEETKGRGRGYRQAPLSPKARQRSSVSTLRQQLRARAIVVMLGEGGLVYRDEFVNHMTLSSQHPEPLVSAVTKLFLSDSLAPLPRRDVHFFLCLHPPAKASASRSL